MDSNRRGPSGIGCIGTILDNYALVSHTGEGQASVAHLRIQISVRRRGWQVHCRFDDCPYQQVDVLLVFSRHDGVLVMVHDSRY